MVFGHVKRLGQSTWARSIREQDFLCLEPSRAIPLMSTGVFGRGTAG